MPEIHAVMFCFPAQGHIIPFLHFAKKLVSKGFIITFANTEHSINRIQQCNANSNCAPDGNVSSSEDGQQCLRLVGLPDGLPQNHCRDLEDLEVLHAIENMDGVFEGLLQKLMLEEPPVSCLIMDAFVPFSRNVASKFKLERTIFWTTTASVYAIHLHTDLLIRQGVLPVTATNQGDIIDCMAGVSSLKATDLPSSMQLDTHHPVFQFFHRHVQDIHEAGWVFVNTIHELESQAVDALRAKGHNVLLVGPLLPPAFVDGNYSPFKAGIRESMWMEDDKCLRWLESRTLVGSVLFISFGSIARLTIELFQEFALGLQASKQPFLWVVRDTLVAGCDPCSMFPEGFLASTQEQGLVISWAPQLSVLSHPSVGGFFTHCGWNSVLESICAGVPLIGWPQSYDQIPICKLVVEGLKIGMRLTMGEGREVRKEVERAVKVVMQEEEGRGMRKRVCELKEVARRSFETSDRNISAFRDEILQKINERGTVIL